MLGEQRALLEEGYWFWSVQPLFSHLAQGCLDQLVFDVISRAANCRDQRPSLWYEPLPAGGDKDSEGANKGNSQSLSAMSPSQIVEHGSMAGIGEAESYDGRFPSPQVPFADGVRDWKVVDDYKPGMRRDGCCEPVLA